MAVFDLVCQTCKHKFQLVTRGPIKDKQKVCPECGTAGVRQTFGSYLRNGALSDPDCGAPSCTTTFG